MGDKYAAKLLLLRNSKKKNLFYITCVINKLLNIFLYINILKILRCVV